MIIASISVALPLRAQNHEPDFAGTWSWSEVRAQPGVDTAKATWLATALSPEESHEVMRLVASLSKPPVVQLLPAFTYLDGLHSSRATQALAESLLVRVDGTPGVVRYAYFIASARQRRLRALAPSTYKAEFGPIRFPQGFGPPDGWRPRSRDVELSFDFAPIETQLAIVQTPDIALSEALRRISTHPFDALIHHHSQSFYLEPLSRERLALNLAHAASTQPLEALYTYMMPDGFYHYGDLRRHGAAYRALLDTLKGHESEVTRYIHQRIDPYIPPETKLSRRVSYFVADHSDGWGSDDVTAVDLEYYKDDIPRLLTTLVHETYHAAQGAARQLGSGVSRVPKTGADSALQHALSSLLIEGTANLLAPTVTRSSASADSMAREGARLLDRLAAMVVGAAPFNADSAQALLNHGVAGGGPFYWTGSAMASVIRSELGDAALGEALKSDGVDYVRLYERALSRKAGVPSLMTPRVIEAVARQ